MKKLSFGNAVFITGTDTEIGKTYVSTGLLDGLNQLGQQTIGLKPFAAGCELYDEGYCNEDALQLQAHASVKLPYDQVNSVALIDPTSPNIAAARQGLSIDINQVCEKVRKLIADYPDHKLIIEGIGGWCVPLNDTENVADFVKRLALPVILVVGMRLGCLNHAILTAKQIMADGLQLIGWVGNCIQADMPYLADNLQTLRQWLPAPCLGVVGYQQVVAEVVKVDWLVDFSDLLMQK